MATITTEPGDNVILDGAKFYLTHDGGLVYLKIDREVNGETQTDTVQFGNDGTRVAGRTQQKWNFTMAVFEEDGSQGYPVA